MRRAVTVRPRARIAGGSTRLPNLLLAVAALASGSHLMADASAGNDEVVKLDTYNVEGVATEDLVMPTARPISSVLGDDRNILDTPRSVSSVNKALMDLRQVKSVSDFSQFSPGVYTPARYGLASTPVIRGDLAEIYVNGQRTNFDRNSVLPSFNGVEALDIVKGPGSAVYGPQAQGPGGYVNFVTKTPYFDGAHTQVSTTLGTWTSGHSYGTAEVQVDTSAPFNDKLAWRLSYLDREGDGYYQNTKDVAHDLFAALTWLPRPGLRVDWWAQYYKQRYNEVPGINRVTQELIDDQIYIAGPVQATNRFGSPVTTSPTFLLLDASQAERKKIHPYQTLNGPDDSAHAERFLSQLAVTAEVGGGEIHSTTLFESAKSDKFQAYGYTEWVPTNWTFDHRTEYHASFDIGPTQHSTITGANFRYQRLVAYQDFSTEPFFLYDLTADPSTFVIPTLLQPNGTVGGYHVPGQPGYSATRFAISGDQDSHVSDIALFHQHDVHFGSHLSAVIGARVDFFTADAANPVTVEHPKGSQYDASGHRTDGSIFASLLFKPTDTTTTYATYNRVNAVTGSPNFGGIDATSGDEELHRSLGAQSELVELGAKAVMLDNKLYAAVDVFRQSRTRPNLVGPASEIQARGIEAEATYQPSAGLTVTANVTYQDVFQTNPGGFYQQTANYLDGYPVGFIVDGQSGTGRGSPNYNTNTTLYRVRYAGTPSLLASAYATYRLPCGLGFGLGPQVTGAQYANANHTLRLPTQFNLDAAIFYAAKSWDVQVNVYNVTDERNWTVIDPDFAGNDVLLPEKPVHATLTARYRF